MPWTHKRGVLRSCDSRTFSRPFQVSFLPPRSQEQSKKVQVTSSHANCSHLLTPWKVQVIVFIPQRFSAPCVCTIPLDPQPTMIAANLDNTYVISPEKYHPYLTPLYLKGWESSSMQLSLEQRRLPHSFI